MGEIDIDVSDRKDRNSILRNSNLRLLAACMDRKEHLEMDCLGEGVVDTYQDKVESDFRLRIQKAVLKTVQSMPDQGRNLYRFGSIDNSIIEDLEAINVPPEIVESIRNDGNINTIYSLLDWSLDLSPEIKDRVSSIVFCILIAVLCGPITNLTTPLIEKFLGKGNISEKETREFFKDNAFLYIDGQHVNIRSEPSIEGAIVDNLNTSKIVSMVNRKAEWVQIVYLSEEETMRGWIHSDYVEKLSY